MKKRLLYSNDYCMITDIYKKSDYDEFCEENDYCGSYEDYISMMEEDDWECLLDNIRYSKFNSCKCRINGTLGLWDGTRKIEPVICDSLEMAIKKCANNMDYITIKCDDEHVYVDAFHHDGTNRFSLTLVDSYTNNDMFIPNGNLF